MVSQRKTKEWNEQWAMFQDDATFLFEDWIHPVVYEDFRGQTVLECGCGGGQHTSFVAPYASSITAVDLNTSHMARERNKRFTNIDYVEADIAHMDLARQFDLVICIGVIHHTDNPDRTFESLYKHCKPGGRLVVWTYSAEGNEFVRYVVEPLRKLFLKNIDRKHIHMLSQIIACVAFYPLMHTIYRIPLFRFLPYYDYFANGRKLPYRRNLLNIFDKLNAPQTHFTTLEKCREWFNDRLFRTDSISIRKYAGVSYSLVGIKK